MRTDQKFIESIRFQGGAYHLLSYHQQRVNRTFQQFFPKKSPLNLEEILPALSHDDRCKVRVVYGENTVDVAYALYQPRPIHSIQLVTHDAIAYGYKYADRNELTSLFQQRKQCDDIIIVKNDQVTDSYYANVALFDGQEWITPESCLLPGVKRQSLIDQHILRTKNVTIRDLQQFQSISLINAMLDLGEIQLPISKIHF